MCRTKHEEPCFTKDKTEVNEKFIEKALLPLLDETISLVSSHMLISIFKDSKYGASQEYSNSDITIVVTGNFIELAIMHQKYKDMLNQALSYCDYGYIAASDGC